MMDTDSEQRQATDSRQPPESGRTKPVHPAERDASGKNQPPLGEKSPGAPFTVVALTYPIVLAIAMIGLALMLWLFNE